MAEKQIKPGVKLALELGPVLLFFLAYTRLKDDVFTLFGRDYDGFIVVTAAFIPVLLASIGVLWALSGKISRMQVVTAVLVVVFGALTVVFNNDAFFKMKTTIVYGLFAVTLGVGLAMGRSFLRDVMEDVLPLLDEGWMILTRRMTAVFAIMAAANEIVWRTLSTDVWVKFETFGLPAALFVFLIAQAGVLEKYSSEEPDGD